MRTQCDRIQAVIVAFQPVMKDQSFTAQLADSFFEARIDSVVDVLYGEPSASIALANMAEIEIALDLSEAGIVSSRAETLRLLRTEDRALAAAGIPIDRCAGVNCSSVVWFTGLSGAGKSTIAGVVSHSLRESRVPVVVLDGDSCRTHLSCGLGFDRSARIENVRRLGFAARRLANAGHCVLVSAISPYRDARAEIRTVLPNLIEVYVSAPISVCESRDTKDLYRRARKGEIANFTGISDPYEPPLSPELECRTDVETIDESAAKVLQCLAGYIDLSGKVLPGGEEASRELLRSALRGTQPPERTVSHPQSQR